VEEKGAEEEKKADKKSNDGVKGGGLLSGRKKKKMKITEPKAPRGPFLDGRGGGTKKGCGGVEVKGSAKGTQKERTIIEEKEVQQKTKSKNNLLMY